MASINPFLPIQEGTGTPSPENVRPIKPAVSIAGGKNLLEISPNKKVVHINSNAGTFTEIESGIQTSSEYNNLGGYLVQVKPNTTYTYSANFSISNSDVAMRIWEYKTKISVITAAGEGLVVNIFGPGTSKSVIFTTSSTTNYIVVGFYTGNSQAYGLTITNMMIEEGSEPTYYEPYRSLDIYGGYLDIANSSVVEEWTMCDFSDVSSWVATSVTSVFRGNLNNHKLTLVNQINAISDSYKSTDRAEKAIADMADKAIKTHDVNKIYIYCKDTNYTTVSDFITAVTGKKIVYELETSITHYLSPTQLVQAMEQLGIKLSSTLIDARRKIILNSPHLEVASGSIANFSTDMKAPLKECKIHFLPVQSGSGDPSPDNIRPITGWTGVNAEHSGKNVAHIVGYSASTPSTPKNPRQLTNSYGTTISTTNPERSVTVTQTNYSASPVSSFRNGYLVIVDDNLKYGETYNVSMNIEVLENPLNAKMTDLVLNNPGGYGGGAGRVVDGNRVTFTHWQYADYDRQRHCLDLRICGMSIIVSDICITPVNETDHSYEPYQSTQIPVSFGDNGTIYGGYVDLVSGELVAEYICETDNGRDWQNVSTDGNYRNVWQWGHTATTRISYVNHLCTHWKNTSFDNELYCGITNTNSFRMCKNFWETVGIIPTNENIKAYFKTQADAGTPLYVCAPLATPITYQLTPQQLKSFKGINNIQSNVGEVEIKYWTH